MPISYSGTSVTATFAAGVINDAWGAVTQLEAESGTALAKLNGAKKSVNGAPLPSPLLDKSTPVDVALNTKQASIDVDWLSRGAALATDRATVVAGIATDAKAFCRTFFLDGLDGTSVYDDAEAWINGLMLSGGSGIAAEGRLRTEDAARIARDARRAVADLNAAWATRGVLLASRVTDQQIENTLRVTGDGQGAAERNARIKSWDVEVTHTKFAIDRSLQLRNDAMERCKAYVVEWLGKRYDQATDRSKEQLAKMGEVKDAYYKFLSVELGLRDVAIDRYLTQYGVDKTKWNNKEELKDAAFKLRVKGLERQLQALSTRASAAVNSIHVSAEATGSEQL